MMNLKSQTVIFLFLISFVFCRLIKFTPRCDKLRGLQNDDSNQTTSGRVDFFWATKQTFSKVYVGIVFAFQEINVSVICKLKKKYYFLM